MLPLVTLKKGDDADTLLDALVYKYGILPYCGLINEPVPGGQGTLRIESIYNLLRGSEYDLKNCALHTFCRAMLSVC